MVWRPLPSPIPTLLSQTRARHVLKDLLHDLENEFQPQTPFEQSLIEAMAVARYRQWRIWAMEKASLDHEMRTQAGLRQSPVRMEGATPAALAFKSLSDNSRSLDLINRYEARYERQYFARPPPSPLKCRTAALPQRLSRRNPCAFPSYHNMPLLSRNPNPPETKTEFTERTRHMRENSPRIPPDRSYRPHFLSFSRIRCPDPLQDDVIPLRNAA